jgi:hypothetical protein
MRSPGEVAVISTAGAGIGRGTAMIVAREGGTGVGRGLEPTLPERLRADVTPPRTAWAAALSSAGLRPRWTGR